MTVRLCKFSSHVIYRSMRDVQTQNRSKTPTMPNICYPPSLPMSTPLILLRHPLQESQNSPSFPSTLTLFPRRSCLTPSLTNIPCIFLHGLIPKESRQRLCFFTGLNVFLVFSPFGQSGDVSGFAGETFVAAGFCVGRQDGGSCCLGAGGW